MNPDMLVESPSARASYTDRVDVLEKVGTLALLPDGLHADRASVARFYGVNEEVVKKTVQRHRDELAANGMRVLAGQELRDTLSLSSHDPRTPSLTIFPKRAILNVGMLLRDSEVAKEVRAYLLNVEESATPEDRQTAVIGQAETDAIASQLAKHMEGLLSAEREKTESAITAAFTPRTVTAIATEQRLGSQPLGDFRNAIVQAVGLDSIREVFPFLDSIGAIRAVTREYAPNKYFVREGWEDVLEDTTVVGKHAITKPGVVRVRAGKQQAFMDRVAVA